MSAVVPTLDGRLILGIVTTDIVKDLINNALSHPNKWQAVARSIALTIAGDVTSLVKLTTKPLNASDSSVPYKLPPHHFEWFSARSDIWPTNTRESIDE